VSVGDHGLMKEKNDWCTKGSLLQQGERGLKKILIPSTGKFWGISVKKGITVFRGGKGVGGRGFNQDGHSG